LIERIVSDGSDSTADGDVGQIKAAIERKIFNVGDTIGNRDAGQRAALERICSDGGHGKPIKCARDDHVIARAGVTRDGGSDPIGVGCEFEAIILPSRCGRGHRQKNAAQEGEEGTFHIINGPSGKINFPLGE
jgi:hypothetical protein